MGLGATITAALARPRVEPAPPREQRITAASDLGSLGQVLGAGGYAGGAASSAAWDEVLNGASRRGRSAAAAYRCVQTIATNLASVPVHVVRGDEPVEDHPVADLFEHPNDSMSGRLFKEVLFARAEVRGQSFVYLDRGPTGEGDVAPGGAWPLYAPVTPVIRKTTFGAESLDGFVVRLANGQRVGLLPSEVLWLRYPDPDDQWGALAPWKAAAHAAEVDELARTWQKTELATGGRPAGVVYVGDLDEGPYRDAKAAWREIASGPGSANRHLVVAGEKEPKLLPLGWTAQEMAYLESRRWNLEEMALAFGVPRDYVVGGSTFDNQRAAKTALWSDLLKSKMEVLSSEGDRQLLPQRDEDLEFDVSEVEALRENVDAIWARAVSGLAGEVLTVDEGRAAVGLDPLPGGIGAVTLSVYRQRALTGPDAAASDAAAARSLLAPNAGRGPGRSRLSIGPRGLRTLPPREVVHIGHVPATVVRSGAARKKPTPIPAATILRAYDRHETAGRRAISRLAEAQQKSVMDRWKKATRKAQPEEGDRVTAAFTGTLVCTSGREIRVGVEDLFAEEFWRGKTKDALRSWLSATWEDGGSTAAARLDLGFDAFNDDVLDHMDRRLDVLADQMTKTTKNAISSGVLEPGVAEGKSIPDLARDLREVFTDLSSWRAEMIARTEVVGGFNAAARDVAIGSGVVKGREWQATSDGRTRDTHAELDGYQTRGLDDPYPNGVMFPGDPSGDAGETINCRCVEIMVLEDD